jgi:hypothetical protein
MPSEPLKTAVQIDPAIRAVEVKITARIEDEDIVLRLLKQSGEEPETRTIYFFDTPGLALFDAGLVLRARKVKGDEDDSTVKLRPVDPARIPIDWMKTEGFEIELDRVGDKEVVSAKLSTPQARGEIDAAVAGERPLRKLFSADQERLIEEFGPADVGWDALTAMGPIDVRKWKVEFDGFPHEVVAERWKLPDGSDLVELSIKVEPGQATAAADEFMAFLEGHGLDVGGDQQTKTRGALIFFTSGTGFD